MFGTIRKHQTWLWAIIITLTIISFVVFFSPYQRLSNGERRAGDWGTINGEKVTEASYSAAAREVRLQYFMRRRAFPDRDPMAKQSGFNEERETYLRLLLLQKIRQFGIQTSETLAVQVASDILRNLQRSGPVSLDEFERVVLKPNRLTVADFERFLRHELALQQLINVVGMSGTLLTPAETQALYRHEHEEVVSQLVLFSASNYLASVTVLPQAVAQYYTNHLAEYRVPPRIQVSYVKFELTNYWNAAYQVLTNSSTNFAATVDAVYQQLGTNYFPDAKSPEEAKQKLIHDETLKVAGSLAGSNANAFAALLLDKEPVRADDLTAQARKDGLTVKVTAPFDQERGPQDFNAPASFTKAAFSLTSEDPIKGPIGGEDAAYVIAFQTNLPSYDPPLEGVRSQVVEDYRFSQAIQLAGQAGRSFHQMLTNGLAQGKSFTSLCLEAKLAPLVLPPFSRSDRSLSKTNIDVPISLLQEVAFTVPKGQVTPFVPLSNGGFIFYLQDRLPLDTTKMQQDLPSFVAMLQQTVQNEAFNRWLREEERTGLRDTPLARPQTSRSR